MMQTTQEKDILINSSQFKSIDGLMMIKDDELLNTNLSEKPLKSMSDDEICYNKYDNIDHDDSDQDEDDNMPPLTLRDATSANGPFQNITTRKRRKDRSHSTQLTLGHNNKTKTIKTLKKQLKVQSDQVQLYQRKITDIQDEREDLEEKLKKEYELKRLHWETKYLQEKSQKSSLQHEIERLKQELFVREQELKRAISVASSYSGTGSVAPAASPNIIPDTPFKRVSTNSVPTIRTNASNNSSNSTISNNQNIGRNSSISSTTTTSSNTISNNNESFESESDSDSDTESSTSDEELKEEGVINTDSKTKGKTKKNQKIPKRLSQKIEKNQPKGFWQTVLYLFGPPDFDCSCSGK